MAGPARIEDLRAWLATAATAISCTARRYTGGAPPAWRGSGSSSAHEGAEVRLRRAEQAQALHERG